MFTQRFIWVLAVEIRKRTIWGILFIIPAAKWLSRKANWEAEKLPGIFFLQKATVTWNLIYGKKMKPSAEKPLVSPKAIICCGVFHMADRGRHWKYVEVSEKMVFVAGLQISQILSLVISCKMSKTQKKRKKTQAEKSVRL